MTYVSRIVQDWLQVALEQEDQGIHHAWLYSWFSFVKEMHTHFGIPDVAAEAAHSVTNFIQPYLHQFFIDSHGLNGYGKPLKRPFNRY